MGVSARICVTFLIISAAIAVPTGDKSKSTINFGEYR